MVIEFAQMEKLLARSCKYNSMIVCDDDGNIDGVLNFNKYNQWL